MRAFWKSKAWMPRACMRARLDETSATTVTSATTALSATKLDASVCNESGCDYMSRVWMQLHAARLDATTAARDWMPMLSKGLDAWRLDARNSMPLDATRLPAWRPDTRAQDSNILIARRLDASRLDERRLSARRLNARRLDPSRMAQGDWMQGC